MMLKVVQGQPWVGLQHWCASYFDTRGIRLDRRTACYAICYLLVLVGVWLRVEHIFVYNPVDHIWSDTQRHWEQGTEVLRRDPMSLTDPVLYQVYIAILGKLTLGEPLLVALYTALLSCLTPWVWYRFARELLPGRLPATAVWAVLSVLPSWITIYAYFMQETLLLPLLGAALYASWRCRRKQTMASFLVMVALWVLAGLTRGIAIPLAAVITTWLWLVQPQKVAKAGYSFALLALALGPLAYRSYAVMNMVSPHGIGQLVALYMRSGKREVHIQYLNDGAEWNYWFGSPSTGEKPFVPFSDWTTDRSGRVSASIDIANGGADWQRAIQEYPLTPARYASLTGENLIYLFFGSSWPDNNRERPLEWVAHHLRWVWGPLALMLLVATVFYWRRLKGQRMLPALIATWFIVQGLLPIAVNEGRYRKPAEGMMLVQVALLLAVRRRRALVGGKVSSVADTVPVVVEAGAVAISPPAISERYAGGETGDGDGIPETPGKPDRLKEDVPV
ncbi:hypothetical protein [Microbulbifer aggregans]|uniref:hypothetical protein n=1 Tax=Microbulbifer aggregans TaxID=1769779 RepID=UPI001CFE5F7F|nr:hypothetical protein [Microbulbifer aggregans]